MRTSLSLAGAVFLSLVLLWRVETYAYIYICLVLIVALLGVAGYEKKTSIKLLALVVASGFFGFLLLEVFLSLKIEKVGEQIEVVYGGHFDPDGRYGLSITPDSQCRMKWYFGDSLIYDVLQTTDQYGRRVMPKDSFLTNEAVFFLGCSFTFGSGVEDNEAMPVRFQEYVQGQYRAFNLGVPSFGAHQMLFMMENGWDQEGLEGYTPKFAIYTGIVDHLLRGTTFPLEQFGPKYVLDDSGELHYRGLFSRLNMKMAHFFFKSRVFSYIYHRYRWATEKDIKLLVAMVKRTAEIFNERYGGPLYYVLWDELNAPRNTYNDLLTALREAGITVLEIKNILPDYEEKKAEYFIYEEAHPTAETHRMVARYLADFILQNPG